MSAFLQEVMSSEAVQNVLMQGYHANRIREALERMILLLGKNIVTISVVTLRRSYKLPMTCC